LPDKISDRQQSWGYEAPRRGRAHALLVVADLFSLYPFLVKNNKKQTQSFFDVQNILWAGNTSDGC